MSIPTQIPYRHHRGMSIFLNTAITLCVFLPRYISVDIGVINITPTNIILIVTTVICSIWLFINFSKLTPCSRKYVRVLLILCILYTIINIISSITTPLDVHDIISPIRFGTSVLSGAIVGAVYFADESQRRRFPSVFTFYVCIIGAIGIYEYVMKYSFIGSFGLMSISANPDTVQFFTEGFFRDGTFRSSSVFTHPILFGQFMAASSIIFIYAIQNGRSMQKIVYAIAYAVCVISMVTSGARSAYIVVIAAHASYVLFVLISKSKEPISAALLFGAISVICVISTYFFYSYIMSNIVFGQSADQISSTEARMDMLKVGIQRLFERPIIGFGASSSLLIAGIFTSRGATIDNFYLTVLLESGVIGLMCFIAIFALIVTRTISAAFNYRKKIQNGFLIAACAFNVSLLVGHSIVSIPDNLFYVLFFSGLPIFLERQREAQSVRVAIHKTHLRKIAGGAALMTLRKGS